MGPILSQFWGLGPTWGHLGISKVKACIPSLHFQGFCLQMGAPLGTQKSHWKPPGGHQSSQGRLLEGTFYGPTFYMKFGSQNYHKNCSCLDRSTRLKRNKYCVELTFSYFLRGPGFTSVWDPFWVSFWHPFWTPFGRRYPPRVPRGAQEGLGKGVLL